MISPELQATALGRLEPMPVQSSQPECSTDQMKPRQERGRTPFDGSDLKWKGGLGKTSDQDSDHFPTLRHQRKSC
eukprot:763216-Hanusia_phi.AAC.3